MGQREPWRAQLAIWSIVVLGGGEVVSMEERRGKLRSEGRRWETYNAYCITPSFFSWLGRGTSLRGLPVTLRGGPWPSC